MSDATRHLSAKYAFHKSAQTHAYLQRLLNLSALADQHQETDHVYHKNDLIIKFHENDASYQETGIKTIITESTQDNDTALRDHLINVRPHISEDEFYDSMYEFGDPDYLVVKDRTIYHSPNHPQLRVYLDAKIEITDSMGHVTIPDDAFFEIQARHADEDDKQEQERVIDTIVTDIRKKHAIRPAPSYGDMTQLS